MNTIRGRLTVWFTGAMAVVLLAFGSALVYERRRPSEQELDQRLASELQYAEESLTESHRVLGQLTTVQDSTRMLAGSVTSPFESTRDLILIADSTGRLLFANASARQLQYDALIRLLDLITPIPEPVRNGYVALPPPAGRLRYLAARDSTAGLEVAAMLVATPTDTPTLEPEHLIRSMLAVAPVVLLFTVGIGYWLAGTALQPLREIMDEVGAITDGRSLHRRVMVPVGAEELAGLAVTLNGMLARLEQSFASLRRFTADASHELRTPLMVVRAGVERALTASQTPPEILSTLDETLNQVNRMSELVDTLLMLARADEGRASLALKETDLHALAADAVETAGMLGEAAGVTASAELPEGPLLLPVDRGRIQQLLLNLITNAVKYTPAGGTVTVGLADRGDQVALWVQDTGIGIAAGDLPQIFSRFWRADVARTRGAEHGGWGLGLAICKWIAEAHGGSINVQSRPGRGTIFTVLLPKQPPTS